MFAFGAGKNFYEFLFPKRVELHIVIKASDAPALFARTPMTKREMEHEVARRIKDQLSPYRPETVVARFYPHEV